MIDFSKLSGSVSLRNSALAAAAVMALTAGGVASAKGPVQFMAQGVKPPVAQESKVSPNAVLYDQTGNPSGNGFTAQNFEAGFDVYDAEAADDFVVPAGGWAIKKVSLNGVYYNGAGPMSSVNIAIYKKTGGLPGAVKCSAPNVVPTDDGLGNIVAKIPKCKLKKGSYFLVANANMDFAVGGQWGWSAETVQSNGPALWQNPGDGFLTGCTAWSNMATCLGQPPTFDLSFKLES